MEGVYAAGYFLFALFFGLVTFVLLFRLALRYCHVSAVNPISHMIHQLTQPVIAPIQQLLASLKISRGRYDWACLVVLFGVELLKFILIGGVFFKGQFPWFLLVIFPLVDLLVQGLSLLMYAVLIRVIISWFNPNWRHPFNDILITVTEPILATVRRYVPDIAGLDFSPFIVIILLKVVAIFISSSMPFHLI